MKLKTQQLQDSQKAKTPIISRGFCLSKDIISFRAVDAFDDGA